MNPTQTMIANLIKVRYKGVIHSALWVSMTPLSANVVGGILSLYPMKTNASVTVIELNVASYHYMGLHVVTSSC